MRPATLLIGLTGKLGMGVHWFGQFDLGERAIAGGAPVRLIRQIGARYSAGGGGNLRELHATVVR
jgi:hypothetical protein